MAFGNSAGVSSLLSGRGRVSKAHVVSQSMQASVTETKGLSSLRSAGMSCRPGLTLDSIMTPVMDRSPARSWAAIASTTLGWLR